MSRFHGSGLRTRARIGIRKKKGFAAETRNRMPSLPKTESDRDRRTETYALPIFFSGYYHALAFDEYCAGKGNGGSKKLRCQDSRDAHVFQMPQSAIHKFTWGILTPGFFFGVAKGFTTIDVKMCSAAQRSKSSDVTIASMRSHCSVERVPCPSTSTEAGTSGSKEWRE